MSNGVTGNRSTRKGCPNYPIEFKRQLAEQACMSGVSVSKLALEHRLNANMLFKWRRHYRAGKFGIPVPEHGIVPMQVSQCAGTGPTQPQWLSVMEVPAAPGNPPAFTEGGLIEIEFARATVRLRGKVDETHIRMVLDCLARQP